VFQTSWPPKKYNIGLKPKVHKQVLVTFMEVHGVGAQNEHFLPSPNRWTNREDELGDPTIFKELRDGGSTRLGGPFELAEFCYNKLEHSAIGSTPFQMVEQVTNCAHDL
jgi:hypothetical protein